MDIDTARRLAEAYADAWNSGDPRAVADLHSPNKSILTIEGTKWAGRIGAMFYAGSIMGGVRNLKVTCDGVRCIGNRIIGFWTLAGTLGGTGRPIRLEGWDDWQVDDDGLILASTRTFDQQDWARQIA